MSEAEITATVNRIYGQIYEVFGDASEMVAREWLDAVADRQAAYLEGARPLDPQPDARELAQKMERRAQRARSATSDFAAHLRERGKDAAIEEAAERVRTDVKAEGNNALLEDGRTRGYEFAWVPHGDTCGFCIALAANGWTRTKKDIDSFKQHVHTHCDCELAARPVGSDVNPPGYDPDRYARIYDGANGGKGSSRDKINAIRRAQYAEDGDRIRQQHRDAYARRQIQTGAYNNSNDPDGTKREAHAVRYYAEVRKRNHDNEVGIIARNSGLDRESVDAARRHLFLNKHDLDKGYDYFDEDYYIAQSWQRLREGKNIQQHDITLIRHEALEAAYMSQGLSYDEAHELTELSYNYVAELTKYLSERAER